MTNTKTTPNNAPPKAERNHKLDLAIVAVILLTVFLVVAPLTIFRVMTNKLVDNITESISANYSKEINTQMTSHIESTLDYYIHEMNTEYEALRLVDNLNVAEVQSFIASILEDNNVSYMAFVDDDGIVYEADGSYLGTMRVPLIGQLLSGNQTTVITDNVTIGGSSYVLIGTYYDTPIVMGSTNIHIILAGMDSDGLAENIVLHSDYSGSYTSIIHDDGSYVLKNTNEIMDGLNVFSGLRKTYDLTEMETAAIKDAIRRSDTYLLSISGDETDEMGLYIYFSPIEGTEWYMVNTLPGDFIKDNVEELRDTLVTMYFIMVVFFALLASSVIILQMVSGKQLKLKQKALKQALHTAEEASRAKTSFLFSMSHDIRTPMNAILGYTDIGLRYVDDPEVSRDSYNKIKRAGGHLLDLINDILEMSRIEAGKMELNEQPMDIREVVADVTTMSESLALSKSIDFQTEIGNLSYPFIYADKLHINEVIVNLISNAVKYTPNGGKVRYTISQVGNLYDGKILYRFVIADNGIGMSEEFQTHLFETFSREQNTTLSKIEGTGLGLSIVKNIVDMAGGTIKVHSTQGEGSTFTVEIPFRVMDEEAVTAFRQEQKAVLATPEEINFEGKKILLVEDNELNREIATYLLADAGFETETAEDGSVALRTVAEKGIDYYDFILMDIQMPVMNGYEATAAIRALPGGNNVPIIALSANAFEEDKKKSMEAGMNAHVAKPIDIHVLLDTMRDLLQNKKPE